MNIRKSTLLIFAASIFLMSNVANETNAQRVSVPGQQAYSRKSYKPKQQRRLRNIGYVGDFSDIACHTWLTPDDVYYLSATELRILRNTIYARHGRKFKDAKLRNYFSQFKWYRPTKNEVSPSELSDTEKHNISLIQSFE